LSNNVNIRNANTCPKKCFHWNDDLNILMSFLETYSSAFVGYIAKLFNSSCSTNVVRSQFHNHVQYEYEINDSVFQINKLQIQWLITSQYLNNFQNWRKYSNGLKIPIVENVPTF
jgi:hypothetical protein